MPDATFEKSVTVLF